jgi:hypothetical protein
MTMSNAPRFFIVSLPPGAINRLMGELMEDHLTSSISEPSRLPSGGVNPVEVGDAVRPLACSAIPNLLYVAKNEQVEGDKRMT